MKMTKISSIQLLFIVVALMAIGALILMGSMLVILAQSGAGNKKEATLEHFEVINESGNQNYPQANDAPLPSGCQYNNPSCPAGYDCISNTCVERAACGNGKCEQGETSYNCCGDCGCPSGQTCDYANQNCKENTCSDGTNYGECSSTKPKFCQNGVLVNNAQLCGCPDFTNYNQATNDCETIKCSDGTPFLQCSTSDKGKMCNGQGVLVASPPLCGCPNGQVLSGSACISQQPAQQTSSSFTSYENAEPYYSAFCDKIDPYDLNVRQAAANAIRNDPGSYTAVQLFDIYDWVKTNIIYQSVPLEGIPYTPSQTLATQSGDCKNQAVLIASMVEAIGGTAQVVADPTCHHAYAIVYYGPAGSDVSSFTQLVTNHYGAGTNVNYFTYKNGYWIIFDPAGGSYPGNTLPECSGSEDRYFMKSCMDCVQQYPSEPYTFGDKCYSQCPPGTISSNQYACKACPQGSYSYNNQCVSCPDGYVLGTNGRCYPQCGAPNQYCITGHCSNGRCVL